MDIPLELILNNFGNSFFQANYTTPQCVFWNHTQRSWSGEGCSLLATSGIKLDECAENKDVTHLNDTKEKVVCGCNHLTNFAVLMVGLCPHTKVLLFIIRICSQHVLAISDDDILRNRTEAFLLRLANDKRLKLPS